MSSVSDNAPATPDRTAVFEARGLTKTYDMGDVQVHALRGVDIDLYRGELMVLLGPSGSGKSTLLNILGGLDVPTAGTVSYFDDELTAAPPRLQLDERHAPVADGGGGNPQHHLVQAPASDRVHNARLIRNRVPLQYAFDAVSERNEQRRWGKPRSVRIYMGKRIRGGSHLNVRQIGARIRQCDARQCYEHRERQDSCGQG